MTPSLTTLARIGSSATRPSPPSRERLGKVAGPAELESLLSLLQCKNGFYAFESALHVFSDLGTATEPGLIAWNDIGTWRREFDGMADDVVFFAEDLFGNQFGMRGPSVVGFDPETGAFSAMAANLEEWASNVLGDYNLWTGCSLAREWQKKHGSIPFGSRLLPITPFILGGDFEVGNLQLMNALDGMKYRASIARQISELPDGATVKLRVIE